MKPRKNPPGNPSPDLALHEGSAQLRPGVRALGAGRWGGAREGKESFPQNVSRETPAVKERMFHVKPSRIPPSRPTPASKPLRARFASPDPSCKRQNALEGDFEGVVATSGYCSLLRSLRRSRRVWASSAAAKKSRKRSSFLGW